MTEATTEGKSLAERANDLANASGSWWNDHEEFTSEQWRFAVAGFDTRLGYWEWVAVKIDEKDHPNG